MAYGSSKSMLGGIHTYEVIFPSAGPFPRNSPIFTIDTLQFRIRAMPRGIAQDSITIGLELRSKSDMNYDPDMEFVIALDDPMTNRQIGCCEGGTKITGIGQDMGSASIRQSTHLSGVPNFRVTVFFHRRRLHIADDPGKDDKLTRTAFEWLFPIKGPYPQHTGLYIDDTLCKMSVNKSKTTGAYGFSVELLEPRKSPLNLQPRLWMKSRNSRNLTTIESRIGYKAATGTLLNRGDCIKMENVRSEDKPRPQDDTAGVTVVFYISETLFAGVGHRLAIVRSLVD